MLASLALAPGILGGCATRDVHGAERYARLNIVSRHRRVTAVRAAVPDATVTPAADPFAVKETYNDSWFDAFMVKLFTAKMRQVTGHASEEEGYAGFVEQSYMLMAKRNALQQRAAVRSVLVSLMPPNAPATFRKLFPPTKTSAEINAWLTGFGFTWLVGPSELKEVEVDDPSAPGGKRKQMSGVLIKKCRYLEASGCVGMCTNLCKLPTQDFFTQDFGLPLTMNPNFTDLSCEMIYGQAPPPFDKDDAAKQPCFVTVCPVAKAGPAPCPKVDAAASVR